MLLAINPFKIKDTFEKNAVRDKYLIDQKKRKKHAVTSVKKHLSSICDFLSFLEMNKMKLMLITTDDTVNVKLRITYWKRMHKSEADKTFWAKHLDDFDKLISPEEVKTYGRSSPSEKARELFKEFNKKDWLLAKSYHQCKLSICVYAFPQ